MASKKGTGKTAPTSGEDVEVLAGNAIEGGLANVEVLCDDFLGCMRQPVRKLQRMS